MLDGRMSMLASASLGETPPPKRGVTTATSYCEGSGVARCRGIGGHLEGRVRPKKILLEKPDLKLPEYSASGLAEQGHVRSVTVLCGRGPMHSRSARLSDRKSTRLNSSHLGISYAV